MKIAVAGSHGLIGTALAARLRDAGHEVIAVPRGDPRAAAGADAVINLAGAGIGDHRWTAAYKAELRDSRIRTTAALAALDPPVLLSASAVGIYGDRGDELLDEQSSLGTDFLAELCRDWEAAAAASRGRVALLRSGVVLAARGGALRKQLPLFRLGLGGRLGSGRHWLSWISLTDEVEAIVHLLGADVEGPVDLTAPNPVRNAEFATTLGKALHRPAAVPVPAFGPKLLFGGEMVDTMVLASQRALPTRLVESGFTFAHPALAGALDAELA
jgi:uncharacterized protein (TIGR01777 family)